jgi:diaminopropionate ammonia-lyase
VPHGTTPSRITAIESEGATVEVVNGDYDAAVRAAASLGNDCQIVVSDTSWPGYETVPDRVIDGYLTIFEEATAQFGRFGIDQPDTVIVPTGVGALAAAAARWYRNANAGNSGRPHIVTVEPITAACVLESIRATSVTTVPGPHTSNMAGLNCGTPSPLAWSDVAPSVRWATAIDDACTEAAMRALAAQQVVAGESGAAGAGLLLGLLYGLVEGDAAEIDALIKQVRGGVTLLLVTEGATDTSSYQRIVGDHERTRGWKSPASATEERPCVY